MMLYARPQLRLLLVLAALFLAGLAVREWRAGFPDMADRVERFDRDESSASEAQQRTNEARPAPSRVPAKLGATPAVALDPSSSLPAGPPILDNKPVDVNRAGVAELSRLPGVGTVLAQRIVDERQRRGRFDSLEALRHVVGVGPKKLAAFRDLVTVGE